MQGSLDASVVTTPLTVSQLSARIRQTLETCIDEVWVVGEISNFRVPLSGHFYFSLKDGRSQVAAVMFRSANRVLPFRPADGMEVIVRARVDLYAPRGDLQLCVEVMEPRGLGSLQLALEQLRNRLAAEGLFAEARKRPLPFMPRGVGVVTALAGAAVHDVLTTLQGRLPGLRIVIRPVRVQGKGAAPDIVQAIGDLNDLPDLDVLIVGRGGGSLEDLWAFNEERVARAIAASRLPIVSAVGHEIDTTIADLVADRRAATPTAAAAMVVPNHDELMLWLVDRTSSLRRNIVSCVRRRREHLAARARQLRDPRRILNTLGRRIDELHERQARTMATHIRLQRQRLRGLGERLHALSPLAVLERGYGIVRRLDDQRVVRDAAAVHPGDALQVILARGSVHARVESCEDA